MIVLCAKIKPNFAVLYFGIKVKQLELPLGLNATCLFEHKLCIYSY